MKSMLLTRLVKKRVEHLPASAVLRNLPTFCQILSCFLTQHFGNRQDVLNHKEIEVIFAECFPNAVLETLEYAPIDSASWHPVTTIP